MRAIITKFLKSIHFQSELNDGKYFLYVSNNIDQILLSVLVLILRDKLLT